MPDTEKDAMAARQLEALEASVRTSEKVFGQMKGLEKEVQSLRETQEREFANLREAFNRQLTELEEEMRSMNSHLDNLVRETVVTNQLLREDMEDRKEVQASRRKFEEEEREWRRTLEERKLTRQQELEDDQRNTLKRVTNEIWTVTKQPLGYLVAGIIFWVLITKLGVSPTVVTPVIQPSVQAPASND